METLLNKAIEQIEIEMNLMGKIDDSDNSDRFLDNLAYHLASTKASDEQAIEKLQEELLENIQSHMKEFYHQYGECDDTGRFTGGYEPRKEVV